LAQKHKEDVKARFTTLEENVETRVTAKMVHEAIEYNNMKMELPWTSKVDKMIAKVQVGIDYCRELIEENKKFTRKKL